MPHDPAVARSYWFPAKRYGWGWGLPRTWQGWVVLISYLMGLLVIALTSNPESHPVRFAILWVVSTVVFLATCWRTGEPPRWRWGKRDDDTASSSTSA